MTSNHSGRFSIIPARAIDDDRLGNAAVRVLSALGTYSDPDGWCWPAIQTLADRLRVSRQQVKRGIKQLEETGYLVRQRRFNTAGREMSSKYRVLYDGNLPAELASWGEGQRSDAPTGGNVVLPPGGKVVMPPEGQRGDAPNDPLNDPTERNIPSIVDRQFEDFWKTYPSRAPHSNPKKPARQRFDAAIKRGVSASEIIRGAKNFAAYVARQGTDPQYVAQAVTWLNQERWDEHKNAASDPKPKFNSDPYMVEASD